MGRRKTAIARVRLFEASKTSYEINGDRNLEAYFPTKKMQLIVQDVFTKSNVTDTFKISAHIEGGGINGQAEALRLGIARALVARDAELRKNLNKTDFWFATSEQRSVVSSV